MFFPKLLLLAPHLFVVLLLKLELVLYVLYVAVDGPHCLQLLYYFIVGFVMRALPS
jgi:hypothetical protein